MNTFLSIYFIQDILCKEVKKALTTLMLSVQDGINVQGGIFHKINKNTGPNKCVQGGIFSKN